MPTFHKSGGVIICIIYMPQTIVLILDVWFTTLLKHGFAITCLWSLSLYWLTMFLRRRIICIILKLYRFHFGYYLRSVSKMSRKLHLSIDKMKFKRKWLRRKAENIVDSSDSNLISPISTLNNPYKTLFIPHWIIHIPLNKPNNHYNVPQFRTF